MLTKAPKFNSNEWMDFYFYDFVNDKKKGINVMNQLDKCMMKEFKPILNYIVWFNFEWCIVWIKQWKCAKSYSFVLWLAMDECKLMHLGMIYVMNMNDWWM